ncbi:RNA directed DNA polymerase [Echinococcus multilocularis]|uniref:RNA directed DNA polymerase n=1 Tax=Echinococcus multilocularis TaxID=6211 RepID=A0A0S4MIE8_ECHMU|nr:RNA directed DNA polymerase [Echinococcus multilocularis]
MSKSNQSQCSKGMRVRKEGINEVRATLVAAPADHSPFNDDMNFKEWLKTAKFNRRLYPQHQGILSILPTLSQDLCSAAIDAGITHDTDIDQCCDTLAQLVIEALRYEDQLAQSSSQAHNQEAAGMSSNLALPEAQQMVKLNNLASHFSALYLKTRPTILSMAPCSVRLCILYIFSWWQPSVMTL